jgi:hypothetical protein
MATVYKSIANQDNKNRTVTVLDSSQSTQVSNILSKFITYFKAKHL